MQIGTFLTLYAISLPLFLILDFLWLGVIAKGLYKEGIANMMGDVVWYAAILFYALFLLGLTYFATYPAMLKGSVPSALALGALFGFFTYMTYDLTNLATLRSWPHLLSFIDIAWGTFLGAVVAGIAVFIYSQFKA